MGRAIRQTDTGRAWWRQLASQLLAQVVRPWHGRAKPQMAQPAGLGVEDLPGGVGYTPTGAAAALVLHTQQDFEAWIPALLMDWLAGGQVLVLGADAGQLDALLATPALRAAHDAGRLRACLLPAAAQRRLRQEGVAALAGELRRAGHDSATALCLLDAHAVLAGASVAQVRRLARQVRRWSAGLRRPLALLFPLHRWPEGGTGQDPAGIAQLVTTAFDHVAQLRTQAEEPCLTLYRWDGASGAVAQARYGLQPLSPQANDGSAGPRLRYSGSLSQGEWPTLVAAPDADTVYATLASVADQRRVPPTWRIVADQHALAEATAQAVGATVLLDAGEPERFEELAALVHRLRSSRPLSLKIVVRETRRRLRVHSEQVLLRLGATSVIYREIGFSRLLRMIDESRALVHAREVETDCAAALRGHSVEPVRGYLAPETFIAQVEDALARSRGTGLEHCLVHLLLLPSVAHLDALRACRALRDGDLFSADAAGVYVFLFGCTQADLDDVLARMFSLPLEQCFGAQLVDASRDGIAAALDELRALGPADLPDFSPLLLQPGAASRRADGGPAPSSSAAPLQGRAGPPQAPSDGSATDLPRAPAGDNANAAPDGNAVGDATGAKPADAGAVMPAPAVLTARPIGRTRTRLSNVREQTHQEAP